MFSFTTDSSCGELSLKSNGHTEHLSGRHGGGPKTWTQEDMELALDALKNHNMSLTKVSLNDYVMIYIYGNYFFLF